MYKFPIIVFEGIEGTGKSFHINTEGCHRAMNDVIALEKLYFNLENQLDKELDKRRKVSQNPEMVYDYIKIK